MAVDDYLSPNLTKEMDSETNGNTGVEVQTTVNPQKERNYKREEDIFLCRAWMATSGDPEEADQSSMNFSGRIGEKYANLIGNSYVLRPRNSLRQRWSKIRAAVSTFCAIYKSINDQNLNNYTEQDMIKMALLTYEKEKKEKFKFLHCWTELRNSFKWNSEGAMKVRGRNVAQPSSIDEHLSLDDDNDCPMTTDMSLEQSDRVKLANQSQGKDVEDIVCSPCTEPSPLSVVSPVFFCSLGDMDSNTHNHVRTDVLTEVSKKVNTRKNFKKVKNYTEEEDIFLCRAWMATDADPVIGKYQSSKTLWGRLGETYTSLIGNNHVPRNEHSLANRWSKIRITVAKFCSIYKNINDQNLSSYTELKKIKMALLTYKKNKKEKFRLLHCWTELRNSFKWNSEGATKVRGRNVAQPSSIDEHLSLDGDNDCPMITNMLEQSDRQKLEKQCEGKDIEDIVYSPCTEPFPLSAVSPVLLCSSGVINFDPHDHTDTDVPTEGSEQVKTKKKESNYTREEDVLLCRAWMDISGDPMKGKDESSVAIWERIVEKYVSLIGSNYVSRTENSLTNRWHKMRPDVLKFSVIYKIVSDQNPSGYTEQDKVNKARVTYKKDGNEKFRFHHCWTVLRHSPKWNEVVSRGGSRIVAFYSQQPITSEHSSFDNDYDSSMTIDTSLEQLEGHLPKEQLMGCGESESVDAAAASRPASSICLSPLYTSVIPSRNMDSSTHNHVKTDVQTEVSKKVNTRKNFKKEKNYTEEEDIFLCRAWMATDADPVIRKYQSSKTLWGRFGEAYTSLIGNIHVPRTECSLGNRWSRIRITVAKFCSIYKNINDQNLSSYTELKKIKMALRTYKKAKNEKFRFFHCWAELRNSFKWNSEGATKVRGRNVAQPSLIDEHLSPDDDNDCPMTTNMLEQSHRLKLTKQCEEKDVEAIVSSPCTESSPLSAASPFFICSSGVINSDPHDHTDTDVQTEGSEQVKTKKKESNFTREEDVFLCRAWIGTSEDPVKGKDESSVAVWKRIVEKYVSLVGSDYVSRTEKSLTYRWHKMRPAVLKFSVIYKIVNDQNLSGYTEQDKINMARVTYKKDGNEKFRFHHCWTVLRHSPKWNAVVSKGMSRIGAMYSQEPIKSDNSSFNDDYDSPMTIDTSSEELDENLPEEQQVGCGEAESASPPAASSRLSALCTPVILSRNMDSNTHNHVRTDVQTEVSEKVNTKKREKNYSEEEDVFLCRAWMATDADSVIGKDNPSMTLWERITEAYAGLIRNNYVARTEPSLATRWTRIRSTVAKFYFIYKNIADQNLGSSELEKINLATLTFQTKCKERFIFLSCWKELKYSPKWNFETTAGVKNRRRHAAMFSQQSSNDEHFSHNNDVSPMHTSTFFNQSQGKKLFTHKRKAQDVDTSSSDVEELLPQTRNLVREIFADQLEVEKLVMRKRMRQDGDMGLSEVGEHDVVRELFVQKVKKLDELLEIEREKSDSKIMLIDPTTLPDGRRQYFEKLQQKILERVCGIQPPSN